MWWQSQKFATTGREKKTKQADFSSKPMPLSDNSEARGIDELGMHLRTNSP